jgi:sugar/nucleoside kinase (ribokinase family)
VTELARVAARHGGVYATHLRSEMQAIIEALHEAGDCAFEAGLPLVISHHKCAGPANWGRTLETLPLIDTLGQRQPIAMDVYPYLAGSTVLREDLVDGVIEVLITWSEPHPETAGRALAEVAAEWGTTQQEAARRIKPGGACYFQMDGADVDRVIAHPRSMIGSDGLPNDRHPHPRLWGAFPRVLAHYWRERGLLTLEQAVHKMTGLTARNFRLEGRGLLRPGGFADITCSTRRAWPTPPPTPSRPASAPASRRSTSTASWRIASRRRCWRAPGACWPVRSAAHGERLFDIVALGEAMVEFNQQGHEHYQAGFGGDTSNCAIAAARLGARTAYVTQLGEDVFGEQLLALWQREGVDTQGVTRLADAPTGIYFVTHGPQGHRFSYRRAGSAASRMTPDSVPAGLIESARWLHVSGISQAISASACDTVLAAIERARGRYAGQLRPQLPPRPVAAARLALLRATLAQCDLFFPSVDEIELLTGLNTPADIVRWSHEQGARAVALKLGMRGSVVSTGGEAIAVPPHPVAPVDATGAGDCLPAPCWRAWRRATTCRAPPARPTWRRRCPPRAWARWRRCRAGRRWPPHRRKNGMNIRDVMRMGPVIPVLVIEREQDAVPLARALVAGGIRVLEVTLRTPAALAATALIAREVPQAVVGGAPSPATPSCWPRAMPAPALASAPASPPS